MSTIPIDYFFIQVYSPKTKNSSLFPNAFSIYHFSFFIDSNQLLFVKSISFLIFFHFPLFLPIKCVCSIIFASANHIVDALPSKFVFFFLPNRNSIENRCFIALPLSLTIWWTQELGNFDKSNKENNWTINNCNANKNKRESCVFDSIYTSITSVIRENTICNRCAKKKWTSPQVQ